MVRVMTDDEVVALLEQLRVEVVQDIRGRVRDVLREVRAVSQRMEPTAEVLELCQAFQCAVVDRLTPEPDLVMDARFADPREHGLGAAPDINADVCAVAGEGHVWVVDSTTAPEGLWCTRCGARCEL